MDYFTNTEAIDAVNSDTDMPGYLYDDEGLRGWRLKYTSTDAWRGYYSAVPVKKNGWQLLDSNWITGDYSDAPDGHGSSDVQLKLDNLAKKLASEGFKMAVVYAPTSNVFSTSYDVFKKEL
jgi:hypothetical protein